MYMAAALYMPPCAWLTLHPVIMSDACWILITRACLGLPFVRLPSGTRIRVIIPTRSYLFQLHRTQAQRKLVRVVGPVHPEVAYIQVGADTCVRSERGLEIRGWQGVVACIQMVRHVTAVV
jgi:hypothetical protein